MPISIFNLLETETDIRTLRKNLTSIALTTIVAVTFHYIKNTSPIEINSSNTINKPIKSLMSFFYTTGLDFFIGILSLCVCYLSIHYLIILLSQLTKPIIQHYSTHVNNLDSQLKYIHDKYDSTTDPRSYLTYRNDYDPDVYDACNENPSDYYCQQDMWYGSLFKKRKHTNRKLTTFNVISTTLNISKNTLLITMPLCVASYALIISLPYTFKILELLPKLIPSQILP